MNISYKIIFGFMKKMFLGLLSFSGALTSMAMASDHTKCIS